MNKFVGTKTGAWGRIILGKLVAVQTQNFCCPGVIRGHDSLLDLCPEIIRLKYTGLKLVVSLFSNPPPPRDGRFYGVCSK
jgi:hypothetical protein